MRNDIFIPDPEWVRFTEYLRSRRRYRLNSHWEAFVRRIAETAEDRQFIVRKGALLSRARIGYFWPRRPFWQNKFSSLYPHPLLCSKMGAPPKRGSIDGRLNPRGISYLYLSSDDKTALAEVRPSTASLVTVGKFRIQRKQRIVDVTDSRDTDRIWRSISDTFSEPMSRYDDSLAYIPTQYLAEAFKDEQYDGIKYASSIRKNGYNVLLFDSTAAKCVRCQLYVVDEVRYRSRRLGRVETDEEQKDRRYY